MNILLTGSEGFIGTNLKLNLENKIDANVFVIDLKFGDDLLTCELPDNIDLVIHLAGLSGVRQSLNNPTEYWKQNVIVSQRIFDTYKDCRVMYASSSTAKEPWRNPYAFSKFAVEQMAPEKTLGMRFTTTYGPNAREQMLIPSIIRNEVPYINIDHSRDFIHVDDLCNAIVMLIDKNEYGVIDIGTGISNKLVDIMNQCKMTYTGTIGLEIERKDNKADISNLTKYGWKPKINLYQYLDKEIERRIN
jgi:nucleoside-diphosphate-sugar epimerase